ncbi:preprotein translocase subunit SecG [bacterium]|nr:preprotein translocase subunit SecG [bacterium]
MSAIISTLHIITCIVLIVAVLLQTGKSADLAGAFGGAGSQTVFGPRGAANILTKITTISAVLFMLTSLGLWILSATGTKSVIRGQEEAKGKPAAAETQKKEETQKKDTEKKGTTTEEKKSETTEKKSNNPGKKDTRTEKKQPEATKKPGLQ